MPDSRDIRLSNVTLDDKYLVTSGRVLLSGIQALVRLPLMQKQRDVAAGLNTAGYISGYRGSPLGGYDQALWNAQKHLDAHNVLFHPGINEDLGMTAVWGTQQLHLSPGARYQGVFGLWYGKGPGVDRSADVLKHANAAGASKFGGVLAVMGDDHACKSSTFPHQSEQACLAALTPVLHAASVQDVLDLGLAGWAMSRFSGCWTGLKLVSDVADSTAVVNVSATAPAFTLPFAQPNLHLRWPDPPVDQEKRLIDEKLPAALAFARHNKLDREMLSAPNPRLGIIAPGIAYTYVRQALIELGLSDKQATDLGLSVYKVAMPWPLEPEGITDFARRNASLFVVEEKRALVESQLKEILYSRNLHPEIIGKRDLSGAPMLPETGEISMVKLAVYIGEQLLALGGPDFLKERVDRIKQSLLTEQPDIFERKPHYCSGCPHNTSTVVPEGSRVLGGIGCHYMALWMERKTETFSHMGGEGVPWLGTAPFTDEKHIFANLGDGTYYHSGLMAIRAAVSGKVNITYKILYNDAVAMTGGQPVDGPLSVPLIAQQLVAEKLAKIIVMTDEIKPYPGLPEGIRVLHRDNLEVVQKELRETPGCTALIYDQTCAAEKRRRRKRGKYPDPAKRVVINDLVCEGCGDCSVKSNCLSVAPLDTEWGTKRQIDQSSCNKDYSCLNGFCPSFVTVEGGELRKPAPLGLGTLTPPPEPTLPTLEGPWNILVSGIGGTGIITIGALLAMAAHLEGKAASTLDQTGLAQKGGAVWSHVRIAKTPAELHAVRLAAGSADLLLAGDTVVAAATETLRRVSPTRTHAVVNSAETITAAFTRDGSIRVPSNTLLDRLKASLQKSYAVDAARLAVELFGNTIAANLFLLGYAWQLGRVPVSHNAIEQAVRLNNVSIEMNLGAFLAGRIAAHNPSALPSIKPIAPDVATDLDEIINRRLVFLTQYQNKEYAERYRKQVFDVRAAERKLGTNALSEAVAKNLFKLMAYKDEYEVARLYAETGFAAKVAQQFEGDYKLKFHLAPPAMGARKRAFGSYMLPLFHILAKFKFLRGTKADLFGLLPERKTERQLITDYEALIREITANLAPHNHAIAVKLAALPDKIRGYGHIKEKNLKAAKTEEATLLVQFRGGSPSPLAARR